MTTAAHVHAHGPARWKVLTAFACVYVIWGSTYLAIRWAIDSVPPFLMAGMRLVPAGLAMIAWQRLSGVPGPTRAQWGGAVLVGGLMLLGGNGSVVWAETRVPSGLVALMVGMVPLWIAVLQRLVGVAHPGPAAWTGVALGLVGVAVLVGPASFGGAHGVDPWAALALVGGTLSWSWGSLMSRRVPQPPSPILGVGMQMLAGGALMVVAGLVFGEGARFDLARVTARSWLSIAYLATFGSIVAFTAYVWLLRVTSPARVATYAFVNPAVAVMLGWALAGEPLTPRTLLATAIIVVAVALITLVPSRPAPAPAGPHDRR